MNGNDESGSLGCGAGCLGALLLTGATFGCHQLFVPEAFGDGQYGFIFFLTVPVGAAIGLVSAYVIALKSHAPQAASSLALKWGLGVMVFLVVLTAGNAYHWFTHGWQNIAGLFPLVGLPLLWAVALAAWGYFIRPK